VLPSGSSSFGVPDQVREAASIFADTDGSEHQDTRSDPEHDTRFDAEEKWFASPDSAIVARLRVPYNLNMEPTQGAQEGQSEDSREALYRIAEAQRGTLERATDAVERKATAFLGFEAVFLALVLGTLAPSPGNSLDVLLSYTCVALLLVGALLLALVVKPRPYRFDPNPQALVDNYWDSADQQLLGQATVNMAEAWSRNQRVHEKKAALLSWALRFITTGIAILAFDVFVVRVFNL